MTSMYHTEHAKRFRVFRNGDRGFLGKEITVSRQNARNWDTFLQHVTDDIKFSEAVRDLCTPTGGTRIACYDDLVDRECYVAVGRGRFRDIGYLSLDATSTPRDRPNNPAKTISGEDLKTLNQHRFKAHSRIYEAAAENDVISIFVYPNGDDINPPRRVTLPRRILTDVDEVMENVNKNVTLVSGGAARLLYTVNGELIHQPHTQLENKAYYVAVGNEYGGFKQVKYGNPMKPAFVTYGNRKPGTDPSHRLRTKNESGSHNTSASSSIPSDALRHHKASSRSQIHLHNKQRAQRNGMSHSYRGAGPFHAQPANASNRYHGVDYDNDEGGVFRSKRSTRYTADEIQDSWETKTDLPIDQRRAEEVEEEASVRTNGYRKVRRPAQIGRKMATTNAHDDYVLRPLNMRQSKVARSFEAKRMEYGENEAVTEREAETLRRGVRRMPPQMRSKARIIEEEDRFEDAGPMKNGLVHRMNERNKPSTRRETPDSHRGGPSDSYRDDHPGRGSRHGDMTDRSDQSVSRTHQRPAGRWNNDNADDADDESFSPRKQRQFSENQEKAAVKIQQSYRGYRARTKGDAM